MRAVNRMAGRLVVGSALWMATLAAAGCSAPDVCAHVSGTCVSVHVEGSGSVSAIEQLELSGSGAYAAPVHTTPSAPQHQALPLDVGITFPAGVSGDEHLSALGLVGGKPTAEGSATVSIVAGKHTQAKLTLSPINIGNPDMGGGDDGGMMVGPDLAGVFNVHITSPSADLYTNGTVSVQLLVENGTADSVQLLLDGSPLASLTAPYAYSWDTTGTAEGEHQLVAHATMGGVSFDSPARIVHVDRTAPTVTARAPLPAATNVEMLAPVTATFSEALKPASVNDGSITVTVGAATVAKTLSLSSDGKTLTITPAWSQVTLPATPQITFDTTVTDLAGNKLTLPAGTWSWSVPIYQTLGGTLLPGASGSIYTRLFTDSTGDHVTYVCTQDHDAFASFITHVFELVSGTWVERGVGSTSILPGNANSYQNHFGDAAWTSKGTLLIGFQASAKNYVASWDGAKWNLVTQYPPAADGTKMDFAVDGNDAPMFVSVTGFAQVDRFDGTSWSKLGGQFGTAISYVVMRKDSTGAPVVATAELPTGATKYVGNLYRFDGANFVNIATAGNVWTDSPTGISLEYSTGGFGTLNLQQGASFYFLESVNGSALKDTFLTTFSTLFSGAPSRDAMTVRLGLPTSSSTNLTVSYRKDSDVKWTDLPIVATNSVTATGAGSSSKVVIDGLNRPVIVYNVIGTSTLASFRANAPLP